LRGERDIAVGNVVGSNIFNIVFVLGLAASVSPSEILVAASVMRFDLPMMIAVAVACLPIFFTGHLIDRWEGALFLGYLRRLHAVPGAGEHRARGTPRVQHGHARLRSPHHRSDPAVVVWRALRAEPLSPEFEALKILRV
jgi:ABC-type long-subunit fatty acid transport system fused permease/ATPase subunit